MLIPVMLNEDNSLLLRAFKAKNDEFYTRYEDIENEVIHYEKELENKVIYCNCDSINSNFLYFFALNFERLKLKKLISTGLLQNYKIEIEKIDEKEFNKTKLKSLILQLKKRLKDRNSETLNNKVIKIKLTKLEKNEDREVGDYKSRECLDLLDESDIVITNPPFSLFRDFFTLLTERKKKFLIIGNQTGAAYNCVFPYFKSGEVRFGLTWARVFDTDKNNQVHVNTEWFTNLKADKYPDKLELTKTYNSKDYPTLDNYSAINVNKVKDIPRDYRGVMAVPVNFLNKHNPNQFKILGLCKRGMGTKYLTKMYKDRVFDAQAVLKEKGVRKCLFIRILIKRV